MKRRIKARLIEVKWEKMSRTKIKRMVKKDLKKVKREKMSLTKV